MKVKNIGVKIIGIGKHILMPDDVAVITEAEANTPAVKTLISFGYLEKVAEEPKKAAKEEEIVESDKEAEENEEAVKEAVSEEKPKKSTRGKKTAAKE